MYFGCNLSAAKDERGIVQSFSPPVFNLARLQVGHRNNVISVVLTKLLLQHGIIRVAYQHDYYREEKENPNEVRRKARRRLMVSIQC